MLSDNGSAYRSKPWREACSARGLTPKRTRLYTPRTNGKADRFIKTLLAEWAYSMAFQTSAERNRWLPCYLAIYNGRRCHMALASRTPIRQLELLRATERPSEKTHIVRISGKDHETPVTDIARLCFVSVGSLGRQQSHRQSFVVA